jgi:hypothetical protein
MKRGGGDRSRPKRKTERQTTGCQYCKYGEKDRSEKELKSLSQLSGPIMVKEQKHDKQNHHAALQQVCCVGQANHPVKPLMPSDKLIQKQLSRNVDLVHLHTCLHFIFNRRMPRNGSSDPESQELSIATRNRRRFDVSHDLAVANHANSDGATPHKSKPSRGKPMSGWPTIHPELRKTDDRRRSSWHKARPSRQQPVLRFGVERPVRRARGPLVHSVVCGCLEERGWRLVATNVR